MLKFNLDDGCKVTLSSTKVNLLVSLYDKDELFIREIILNHNDIINILFENYNKEYNN